MENFGGTHTFISVIIKSPTICVNYSHSSVQVTAMDGVVIRIHFPGWSPKHDRWLSLQSEWKNLAPINLLSGRQRETGGPLNAEQATATYHYLLTGALPPGIDIGESDSEFSVTSSDADNSIATARTNSRGNNRGASNCRGKSPQNNNFSFESETHPSLSVGLKVEVQDLFRTKLNEGVKAKWRVAEVMKIEESIVRIHFVGWDPKWDEDIDISRDRNRIREFIADSKNKPEPKSLKKLKEQKKSFGHLDRFPKQLTPVQEVSERSSPSISHSSSGVIILPDCIGVSGKSIEGKGIEDAISVLGAPSPVLDAVEEDADENFSRRNSTREQLSGSQSTVTDETYLSVEDKIRIAMQVADKKLQESVINNRAVISHLTETFEEKIRLAVLAADKKFEDNLANGTSFIRSSFASDGCSSVKTSPSGRRLNLPEDLLRDKLEKIGLFVKKVADDGNSLFRAVSHQMHLTESRHIEIRKLCVDHMLKHRERFEMFCTGNFVQHIKDIAVVGYSGDELEIRALEEVLDRIFYVYRSGIAVNDIKPVPADTNEEEMNLLPTVEPIKILCHGSGHYSSVVNQVEPAPLGERTSRLLVNYRVDAFEANSVEI
jgi:OTU-like cysteine protease